MTNLQPKWKACHKCQSLFFDGPFGTNRCPAGGPHDGSQSGSYFLIHNP